MSQKGKNAGEEQVHLLLLLSEFRKKYKIMKSKGLVVSRSQRATLDYRLFFHISKAILDNTIIFYNSIFIECDCNID